MLEIMGKKVTVCNKICSECAFNGNSTNTLYAETERIIENKQIFPCHMYLKSQTGCEFLGTETLNTIKVCRGYVAFMLKNHKDILINQRGLKHSLWVDLIGEILHDDLSNICTPEELSARHIGLREKINMR